MKKSMLVLALVAMAAFAAPSMASAAEWKRDGEQLEEPEQMELSGWISWSVGGGAYGYQCEITGHATLWPGDEGEVTEAAFPNCKSTGGATGFYGNGVAESLPWSLYALENNQVELGNYVNSILWQPEGLLGKWTTQHCGYGVLDPNPDLSSTLISMTVCPKGGGAPAVATGVLNMSPEFGGTFNVG